MILEQFLPTLVALASTDWQPVSVHMLAMLVDKMDKRGLALVSANLSSNVSLVDIVSKVNRFTAM